MINNITQVKKNLSTTKSFNYSHETVNLNFSLNIDNKKQMISFIKLLDEAKKDLEGEV